jgi:citrate lyase alpha subunit
LTTSAETVVKLASKKKMSSHKKVVKALKKARDKVGKRLSKKTGIMVSIEKIMRKGDRDLYDVLDDLLQQVAKNRSDKDQPDD